MVMPARAEFWTREMVLALPDDGNRYELVDGALLVSPSPHYTHQYGVLGLYRLVHAFVADHGIGSVLVSPADLDLRSGQLVQPDLFVSGMVDGRLVRDWEDVGIPLLVVEVLSPSTARHDRITKRRLYQRSGVPMYWIVDLDARQVEVWTPDAINPQIARDALTWQPEGASEPLVIELAAYFREVWGEDK